MDKEKTKTRGGKIRFQYEVHKTKDGKTNLIETKEFLSPPDAILYVMEGSEFLKVKASEILHQVRKEKDIVNLRGFDCVSDGSYTFHRIIDANLEQESQVHYHQMKIFYETARVSGAKIFESHLKFILDNNDELRQIVWNKKQGSVRFFDTDGEVKSNIRTQFFNGMCDLRNFLWEFGTNLNVMNFIDEVSGEIEIKLSKEV